MTTKRKASKAPKKQRLFVLLYSNGYEDGWRVALSKSRFEVEMWASGYTKTKIIEVRL